MTGSSPLSALVAALADGSVEVVDLTSPLSASTPVIQLPPEFGQTARFALDEISRYDDRGPAWYWNNFTSGEHTGTHFDAPNHWVTGKDLADVASVPANRLIAPAVVATSPPRSRRTPTSSSRSTISRLGRRRTYPSRTAAGCSSVPDGTRGRTRRKRSSMPTRTGRIRRACRRSAHGGSRRSRPYSALVSRPLAPTPARRIRSTRRSRATRT